MLHHLIQRGYKKRCIHDAIKKTSFVTREETLADKTKPKSLQRVPFVVTYNPMLPNIPKILHEAHPILHASERCTEIFKNVPLVSYWRARDLSDILSSKRLASPKSHNPIPSQTCQNNNDNPPPNTNQCPECGLKLKNSKGLKIHQSSKHLQKQNKPTSLGFWLCHSDTRCNTCKQGLFTTSITSSSNGKTLSIKQLVTCKTKNVCYLINCKKCSQQYIGETKLQFHVRMNNHASDIRTNKKSTGMIRHFTDCGVNNIQPVILERVRSSDPFIRKVREQLYIESSGNRNQCPIIFSYISFSFINFSLIFILL